MQPIHLEIENINEQTVVVHSVKPSIRLPIHLEYEARLSADVSEWVIDAERTANSSGDGRQMKWNRTFIPTDSLLSVAAAAGLIEFIAVAASRFGGCSTDFGPE